MADQQLTAHAAKKLLREEMKRLGMPESRLTARTWDFADLAREKCVFVTIQEWNGSPTQWNELKAFAVNKGFRIHI